MGEEKSENITASSGSNNKRSMSDPKGSKVESNATKNFFKTAFAGRGNEMLGLGLVLGGLLAGLSIYLEQAGPVGDVVDGAAVDHRNNKASSPHFDGGHRFSDV